MAHFVLVADHSHWPLYLVISHIDQHQDDYVSFHMCRTRSGDKNKHKRPHSKKRYMLSWDVARRRVVESSEWRQLVQQDSDLAEWTRKNIEGYMALDGIAAGVL